ncbi:MAG: hypothetical protein KKH98_10175 [Spirochaetes bacterium]|nr:hypothetical protein [Spirochaetota bacterium]
MVKILIIILLLFQNLCAENVRGLYDEFLKPGAESKGYMEALTASDLGLISVFYNPANIALSANEIDFYFSKENYYLIKDISHMTAGVGSKILEDPVIYAALSWRKFDYFDLLAYDDNENIITFSLGFKKSFLLLGANLKYYHSYLDSSDFHFVASGLGVDAGLSLRFKRFLFSISALNLTAELKYNDEKTVPLKGQYRTGINYEPYKNLLLYLDGSMMGGKNRLNFAADYKLLRALHFSAGVSSEQEAGAGIYFSLNKFIVKYGFSYSLSDSFNRNAITFTFGI